MGANTAPSGNSVFRWYCEFEGMLGFLPEGSPCFDHIEIGKAKCCGVAKQGATGILGPVKLCSIGCG